MQTYNKYFKNSKKIPLDKFFDDVLYNEKYGYYSTKYPFENKGDFITAPSISPLFSEMIAIWIISFWEKLNKPNKLNIVELGSGNGKLVRTLITSLKKFPELYKKSNFYIYEKSKFLQKYQKRNLKKFEIKWLSNFDIINKGPVIFIGNEFFDSMPVKQFTKKGKYFYENYVHLNKNKQIELSLVKVKKNIAREIKKFKVLDNQNFIEYPKLGFKELKPIMKKINKNGGGLLLVDYGYIKQKNMNTLQSVMKHKKNYIFKNLGNADVTYLVNFSLLKNYFIINNLKVENIVTQNFFLNKLGILKRAEILSLKMSFKEKSDLYLRLKRL